MTTDEPAADDDLARTGSQVTQLIAAVGPPLTVATGLLFYFGWVRTAVEATTLGVDYTVFGYTTQDYVLRSVSSLFLPLVFGAAAGIGVLTLHGWLLRGIGTGPVRRRHRVARRLGSLLLPAWAVLPLAAYVIEATTPQLAGLVLPLAIAVGLLLTAYGVVLRRRTATDAHLLDTPTERRRGLRVRVLVGIVVAAALFWWIGEFAGVVGRGLAHRIAADVDRLPGVVIYSERDLHLAGAGVRGTLLTDEESSAYRYRYDGLRLLDRTNGRLFLLPARWTLEVGTVIVIVDDDRVRIEYTHGLN